MKYEANTKTVRNRAIIQMAKDLHLTYAEIGVLFVISKQRIQQILKRANVRRRKKEGDND